MSEPDDRDQLWSEATLWFARMRSPDADEFRSQFEEWLSRGALHRRYYNRASEHWLHGTAAFAEERARIHGSGTRREPPLGRRGTHGALAAVVVASGLIAGAAFLVVTNRPEDGHREPGVAATRVPSSPARFATARSERRAMRLADGSRVTLGGNALLEVQLGTDMRRLQLDRGSARFDVAHEPRPFVVFAGGGSVTAHGTLFDVGVSASREVSVRLIRGSIDVRFPASARTSAAALHRTLHPGETVSFEAAGAGDSRRIVPIERSPAVSARDYRDVRLADIIGEANRHATVPIRLANPGAGAQLVSGRFRIDDTKLLAERLAALFDLDVDRGNRSEIVLRSR